MTSQEANSIPLEDILSRYGYEPSRRYGGYDMYRSPFRCDSSPIFRFSGTRTAGMTSETAATAGLWIWSCASRTALSHRL